MLAHRMKIRIDTESDVTKIVSIATKLSDEIKVEIVDGEGMRVNARSIIGMLYAMTFNEIWLESNYDVYHYFSDFLVD